MSRGSDCGSRSNACTAKNLSSSAGPIPKARPFLGALLLAYYDPDERLVYAGRAGTGIDYAELERLWRRLQPLAISEMPLDAPPPRDSRFGSPLTLSRVHWVRPELVAEVKFLTWTEDNLLRQVVYEGLREDKPALCRSRNPARRRARASAHNARLKFPAYRCGRVKMIAAVSYRLARSTSSRRMPGDRVRRASPCSWTSRDDHRRRPAGPAVRAARSGQART